MAMVRTMFSPRCWATSRSRRNGSQVRWSVFWVSRAFRIAGSGPSNSTSTTAPMTWAMRPRASPAATAGAALFAAFGAAALRAAGFLAGVFAAIAMMSGPSSVCRGLERFGAGDDFDQLGGDLGLTRAVVLQGQGVDQLTGVAGGVVHGAHLGAEEPGLVFVQGGQDLGGDVARQEGLENLLLGGLVLVDRAAQVDRGGVALDHRGDQLAGRGDLADHRLEAAVEQGHHVGGAGFELLGDQLGDRLGRREAERLVLGEFEGPHDVVAELALELVARLLADGDHPDLAALGDQFADAVAGGAHDVGREAAGQALVGRGHD